MTDDWLWFYSRDGGETYHGGHDMRADAIRQALAEGVGSVRLIFARLGEIDGDLFDGAGLADMIEDANEGDWGAVSICDQFPAGALDQLAARLNAVTTRWLRAQGARPWAFEEVADEEELDLATIGLCAEIASAMQARGAIPEAMADLFAAFHEGDDDEAAAAVRRLQHLIGPPPPRPDPDQPPLPLGAPLVEPSAS